MIAVFKTPKPTQPPSEDDATAKQRALFWTKMREFGLDHDKVHEILDVTSVNDVPGGFPAALERVRAHLEASRIPNGAGDRVPIARWNTLVDRAEPFGIKLPDAVGKQSVPAAWYERGALIVAVAEAEAEAEAKQVEIDTAGELKSNEEYQQRLTYVSERIRLATESPDPTPEYPGEVPEGEELTV